MKSFDHRNADDRREFRLGGVRDREGTEDLSAPSFLQVELGSDRGGHAAGSGCLITAPVSFFATQIAGIGVSTAWALIAAGEIETIAVGRRRLVVIESWRNYVARKLAAPPEDARRNNHVRPSARLRSTARPAGLASVTEAPERVGRHSGSGSVQSRGRHTRVAR
jgi:hypothetical protein